MARAALRAQSPPAAAAAQASPGRDARAPLDARGQVPLGDVFIVLIALACAVYVLASALTP